MLDWSLLRFSTYGSGKVGMNDTAPTQGPRIYRLRTLIAIALASAILGFAIARLILYICSFSG